MLNDCVMNDKNVVFHVFFESVTDGRTDRASARGPSGPKNSPADQHSDGEKVGCHLHLLHLA